MGFIIPITGLLIFMISFVACTDPEPFDHDVDAAFDELERTGNGAAISEAPRAHALQKTKNTEEAEMVGTLNMAEMAGTIN